MSYPWIKLHSALKRNPAFRQLREAHDDYLWWWVQIGWIAADADDDGKLTYQRGKPWTVEQLAVELDAPVEDLKNLIKLAIQLDFLEKTGQTLALADPRNWYGSTALTGAERTKKHRERTKAERAEDDPENRNETVTDECNERSLHHRNGPSNGPSNECNKAEQSRADKIRSEKEQSRAEQISCVRTSAACLPAVSQIEFFENASELCRDLTGKELGKADRDHLLQLMTKNGHWSGHDWRHKLGALELATQRALWRLTPKLEGGGGEKSKHPWRWMLSWAQDHIEESRSYCISNDVARDFGEATKPMLWEADQ